MTVSPEKIAEMMAAAEKATPGPRERHVIDASTYRYVEDAEKAVARDQADADFNALCDPQTITALLTELQHRREAEAGRGWVFFNPDSGTEYAESHPIESGEADDAEDIRKSTHFEDFLIEQLREAHAREVAASPSSPASGVRVSEEDIDRTREALSALREGHRRKMNAAADRAEMAASIGEMGEVSVNSTESERHREAFVALNVAIGIFDEMGLSALGEHP